MRFFLRLLALSLSLTLTASLDAMAQDTLKVEKIGPVVPEYFQAPAHVGGWYVKTNAATYPLLVSNVAVEMEMGPHMSVSLPFYYSALNWFSDARKFRVIGTQPELRWWFRDPAFQGPFVAVHGTLGGYNIALGGDFRYQDRDQNRPTYGGGVNVGWKLPVGKSGHWGLEFTLGAGYLHLDYDRFVNGKDGAWMDSQVKNWFGPDNVAVTLAYRIPYHR